MSTTRKFPLLIALFALVLGTAIAQAQTYKGVELVKADLLADTTSIAPGKPFTVGLRLKMAPHWHTYWQYGGDAGLPTKIKWELPEGFKAGSFQWPVPEKIVSPGDIINYGYNNEVMLLTEITPPAQLPPGEVTLKGKADWLVCEMTCVPGSAQLSVKVLTGGESAGANAEVFEKTRAALPRPASEWKTTNGVASYGVALGDDKIEVFFRGNPGQFEGGGEFFPLPGDAITIGHPTESELSEDRSTVKCLVPILDGPKDAGQLRGVYTFRAGGKTLAYALPAAVSKPDLSTVPGLPGANEASGTGALASQGAPQGGSTPPPGGGGVSKALVAPAGSLGYFLFLGLLGGLILNVMPCVLPVISLKLFSFVKQSNEAPERILRLGLAYTAGVFTWFLGFAALVVILKAAGREVGYAFHLQSPWFLVALSAATFVFALNLLGVFEIILPGAVTNAAGEASGKREGYAGAYVQGILATVLGSACTAPIFGAALGFAFSQSAIVIFLMFAAIATGMSAPFLLISANPRWLGFLPKPGMWMERVKQGTGFLMLTTVLWLLWTLGRVRGADAIVWTGALLLFLGAACWVQGAFNTLVADDLSRWLARLAIAVLLIGGGWFSVTQIKEAQLPVVASTESFTVQLDAALKTGRPVFVDFTADWCVNCKVNERLVLSTNEVQRAIKDRNAVFLKADWTTGADDITRLLRQFGRAGVPLYVLYPAGKTDAPVVMPELLTSQIVLDAFAEADQRANGGKAVAAR